MIKRNILNFYTIISAIFIIYGLGLFIFDNNAFGNRIVLLLGFIFIFFDIQRKYFKSNKYMKWLKILITIGLIITAGLMLFITFKINVPSSDETEDIVIVLGSYLNGSEVPDTLKERLDTCIEYYNKNPKADIIVSGGQGFSEDVTEASAMEKYLIEHNIPKEKIIQEDKSSSTYENFLFSKKILEEKYASIKDLKIAFITNHFHCYRSYNLAKNAGLEVYCKSAKDDFKTAFPAYLREAAAVIKLWVLGI